MDIVAFVIEMTGTIAFAVSGALVAIDKKMDLLGICVLGVTTAVGGGVIRDVILGNTPPHAFDTPVYIITAIVVSVLVFLPGIRRLIRSEQTRFDRVLLVMDSLGLSIFTVIGIEVAYQTSDNGFLLLFVGALTGVGGGVLRDVLAGQMPYILVKHFYCMAAIIGAVLTIVLWEPLGKSAAMSIGVAVIFVLRLMAAHYRWKLPRA